MQFSKWLLEDLMLNLRSSTRQTHMFGMMLNLRSSTRQTHMFGMSFSIKRTNNHQMWPFVL